MFRSLLEYLALPAVTHSKARANRQPRTCGLAVETLEERCTPAALISIGDFTVVEGDNGTQNAVVQVTVSQPHGNNVTVNYSTFNGSATAGNDFNAVSGTLKFTKNELTKSILIPIHDDRLVELTESFSVRLSNAKAAQIGRSEGFVTITDNEPRVSIDSPTLLEGNVDTATMTFNVRLQRAYDLPVTVNYTTTGGNATPGEDYTAVSDTLTFLPGETLKPIEVAVNGDRFLESDETIVVNVTTSDSVVTITNGQGIGTVIDNEPRLYIYDAVQDYYASSMTFYVYLAVPYDQVVTVDFSTWDDGWGAIAGVDYTAASGTLQFNPDDTWQPITIELLTIEPYTNQYFYLQLSEPSANALLVNELAIGNWYYDWWW